MSIRFFRLEREPTDDGRHWLRLLIHHAGERMPTVAGTLCFEEEEWEALICTTSGSFAS
jgi:hypothetical protein